MFMVKKIINIVLVILWMIVIFSLSNQNSLETTETTSIIYRIFRITSESDVVFIIIRKLAHIIEYLILGFLLCNMFNSLNVKNVFVYTVIICAIYSCSDEIHQLFIDGRNCQFIDCLIDVLGSIIGILFYKIKNKIINHYQKV